MPSIIEEANLFHQSQVNSTIPLDQSTNAPKILAINGVFMGIALVVVLLRFFVRSIMLKSVGSDDWVMAASMTFGVGVFVCFIGETSHGVGKHTKSISNDEMVKLLHWQYFHSLLVTIGISLIKISVAFFLLRLVPNKAYKIFLWCMIAFLICFTIASEATIAFSCTPIRASWDLSLALTAKCFSKNTFTAIGLFNSSINIITDVLFACLPIPMVWTLQVNKRTKLTLIFILSLGLFACAAALIKTVYQSTILSDLDSTRNYTYFVWNSIELYIGILAASLPSLRPLFKRFLETTRNMRTRRTGVSSSGNMGARHKYYMQEDAIAMNSLPNGGQRSSKYDVQVTTSARSVPSDDDLKAGRDSPENLLPMQGITKTTQVTIV